MKEGKANVPYRVSTDGKVWSTYYLRRFKDHEIDREMDPCPWLYHFYQERYL